MKKILVAVVAMLFSHVAFAKDACKGKKEKGCKGKCAWTDGVCAAAKPMAKAAKAAKTAAPAKEAAPAAKTEAEPADAVPAEAAPVEGEDLEDM